MSAGNEITVTVVDGPSVGVAVAAAVGDALYITDGATASVSVTSVGDRGPKGDTGPANVLAVGTVATGASGSTAVVTITGAAPSQVINFTIPRGDIGAVGPAGANGTNGTNGVSGTFADAQQINARTSNYTLVISDAGKLITANHTSSANSITISVPAGASVNFPVGTHIDIARLGAATVTVIGDPGVTVNGTPGRTLRAQYSAATLIEVAADSWLIVGDLST